MHLILFFSRGMSLQTWAEIGVLEREIAVYLALQKNGIQISFITYGGEGDLKFGHQLEGIKVLCNRWNLPMPWYERLIPLLHFNRLCNANLYKTNQTNGAEIALRAAKIWHKPLIARCGYLWSEFAMRQSDLEQFDLAIKIERQVFENANHIVVTTHTMKSYVVEKYNVISSKISVVPNYVMTDLFSPGDEKELPNRICFIGRLHKQKNLHALVQACEGLDVELHMVGEGQLRSSLMNQAANLKVKLVLYGNLPHHELPKMIRQSAIFALVSHYEGHPKALLEAMSCGVAVLAADSPGIRSQIIHGKSGWLVKTDAASIRDGIRHLRSNSDLCATLGRKARSYILENCSLDKVAEMEYALLNDLLNGENQ